MSPSALPLVSVITAYAGNPLLARCVESVARQNVDAIQHLVVADGPAHWESARAVLAATRGAARVDLLQMPYATGRDRFMCHRIYGAAAFLAEGEYLAFLDDDNAMSAPDHLQSCLAQIRAGRAWAHSLRNIVDSQLRFVCRDDCESLGRWPSWLGPDDHLVDVNCYVLPRQLALTVAPLWYRQFREPGVADVDRALCHALLRIAPDVGCTGRYTLDYLAGHTALSVQPEFFLRGNAVMRERHGERMPWAAQ